MIKINLLPPEMRRPERTPLAKMVGVVIGVIVVSLSILAYLGITTAWLPQVRAELVQKTEIQKQREREAQKYDQLVLERDKFMGRRNAVNELMQKRLVWSKKLDELVDLVPASVWLSEIRVEEPPATVAKGAQEKGPTLTLRCYAAGTNEAVIANFLDRLRSANAEFYADFVSIEPPGWQTKSEERVQEGTALEFTIVMHMKPLSARVQPTTPPAASTTAIKEPADG